MLASTDGLPGPVMVKKFGNPAVWMPSSVRAPSAHASRRSRPSRPRMSMRSSAPVMASNPVAKMMTSSAKSPCPVRMPVAVDLLDPAASQVDKRHVVAVRKVS
jgi:hypothetical protein